MLKPLIAAIRDADYQRREAELLARVNEVLNPPPKPDWRESDEAKQIKAQIVGEVEKLVDEGRVIDLSDYDKALKAYSDWFERVSVALGRIDSQMRRFGRHTAYKFDWDKNDRALRKGFPDEESRKQMFRLEIHSAISALNTIRARINYDTLRKFDESPM